MSEITPYLQAFVGLLAIVNPLGAVPVFLALTADRSHEERRAIARMAALTVLFVLLAATWGGEWILRFFGIRLPAFRVGGGLLILLMAVAMLHAHQSRICHTEDEAEEASGRESVAVVPLGIPLMAGPGAISLTILHAHHFDALLERFFLSFCVALVALVVWTVLHLAEPLGRWLGITGLNILIRIMGLLLAAIGVQIVAEGSVELILSSIYEDHPRLRLAKKTGTAPSTRRRVRSPSRGHRRTSAGGRIPFRICSPLGPRKGRRGL